MITQTLNDGVLTLCLDRPGKKNALTAAMYRALTDGLQAASSDDNVRVVILCAEGPDFCAGNDILDFAHGLPELKAAENLEDLPVFAFLKALTFFAKPLVCAVQGQAVGVGVTVLLHCDLVVVADDARLTLPFLKLGLVPEAGSTLLLPRRIGHARAFAWMALGEAIDAQKALDMGLINRITTPEALRATAQQMALQLTRLSPEALRHTKALMRNPDEVWPVVCAEGDIFRALLSSPQAQAAFMAFLNR
ncbi:enoyl-CoA hydratase-related protein [Asticcacaulis sp. EMRT-3]|uniref:enoyl-CoA hydratase-related protein n=1 Tax=Asticcacaulis sp. EMRT-3 TaxID=3040349 RepID=UPI0024AEDD3F|nr:enoyl-CoA hydratase-related protein [Asticcacaulis sp. EMRT-3]MDI7774889.1 enoyl-CoA hydratase-related protein [Asticcacaulis sp. EMRT-3]